MAGVYFADSFYWIALANPRDTFHARVVTWERRSLSARFITTEEILGEVLTWFAASGSAARAAAAELVRDTLSDASIRVLPQNSVDFHAALAFYESRLDKKYSLTDCRSMIALRALGISEVLTNDHHFTQEGFTILFP
ncbi:MAG: type II toxin-antitoxin system VapC family toxin [Pirellulaceae bacterium]